VSESKNKLRFWLVIFKDDMPVGTEFKPGKLHITVLPWFVSNRTNEEVVESFRRFEFGSQFKLKVDSKAMFGPKKNVPVNLIEESDDLRKLHNASLNWLELIDGRWAVKNSYVGSEFKPHIRRRAGTRLADGQTIDVKRLALVEASRNEDDIRRVSAKVDLI
jgi:2'-5' RNA ligase